MALLLIGNNFEHTVNLLKQEINYFYYQTKFILVTRQDFLSKSNKRSIDSLSSKFQVKGLREKSFNFKNETFSDYSPNCFIRRSEVRNIYWQFYNKNLSNYVTKSYSLKSFVDFSKFKHKHSRTNNNKKSVQNLTFISIKGTTILLKCDYKL